MRPRRMTVLNKTAPRVTAMAFIVVLASSVGFGQGQDHSAGRRAGGAAADSRSHSWR
jgi:hypothetical protein